MLKSYEVVIQNGQIQWLKEHPKVQSARAILTFLEDDLIVEKVDRVEDNELKLQDLGGSEPDAEEITRRRYEI